MTEEMMETKVMDPKGRIRELRILLKHNNICIIRLSFDERRKRGGLGLFHKIVAEKFCNMQKDTDIKIQEVQGTLVKFNKS